MDKDTTSVLCIMAVICCMMVGYAAYTIIKNLEDESKYGAIHCGYVRVLTPGGYEAWESKCWRQKD